MKKFIQFSILLALLATSFSTFAQKKIKEGIVKFEIVTEGADPNDEMAAVMNGSTLDFYFNSDKQKMDMSMMGGMIKIQTIYSAANPKDAAMLMDMMGQKIHVIEISQDEISNANAFMNPDKFASVTYDEKDKKDIAGYSCHLAKVKLKGEEAGQEMEMTMYVTDKIKAPMPTDAKKSQVALKGYPLEFSIALPEGQAMTFRATEVKDSVSDDDFKVPGGYTKMTMDEFQKSMGGMDFNLGK